MKGSKRKRGRKWELRVSTGKRNLQTGRPEYAYAYCDGRLTVREVDKELAKLMHTVETGKYVRPDNPKMTVADCLKWWIEEYAKSPGKNLSLKTIQEYEKQIENHIIPLIGNIRLLELTAEHIQDFYKSKQQDGARLDGKTGGLSKRSRRLIHTILNQSLKKATGKHISHNPMADLDEAHKPSSIRLRDKRYQHLDRGQMDFILRMVSKSLGYRKYYHLFKLMYLTGLRRSESLGLQWQDIHIDNYDENGEWSPYVVVARGRQRLDIRYGKAEIVQQPKWHSGRTIWLDVNEEGWSETASTLREYREKQMALWITLGKILQPDDYVFTDEFGKPFIPDSVSQAWRNIANRCGYKGVHLHNLRHSHATMLVNIGVDAETVRDRLGHANVATTLGTYYESNPRRQREMARRLGNYLQQGVKSGHNRQVRT